MKGCITKRVGKRGITWQVVIDLPRDPETGKRRQKWLTAPTKRKAEALAAQYVTTIGNGGFAEADATKITVSDYLARWLQHTSQSVRPSTHRRYADVVRRHIEPKIGRILLANLSPLEVQHLYADRLATGLSPTTVALIHNILHRALKQAIRWGLLIRNVTESTDPPKEATPEYVTWNEHQAVAFLAVADRHDLAALWRLALLTGMRRGEILGLKWEDLDMARGALSVKRTLSRGPAGSFDFGQPKTQHGRRLVALPRSVVESLHQHWAKQAEHIGKVGDAYHDLGLIFANAVGEPLHPNSVRYSFLRLIKEAGVPVIRFHDIRHTSATLMLANGEHPKIVQERLGHANIGITLDRYSHVSPDMQHDAAARLDDLLDAAS